jgi:hypothetical protein
VALFDKQPTSRKGSLMARRSAQAHPEDEVHIDDILKRISDPTARKQFEDELRKANPNVKINRPKRVLVAVGPAVKDHNPLEPWQAAKVR